MADDQPSRRAATPPDATETPRSRASGSRADSPRPTLKTLSKATGLAIATVSRALHDAPDRPGDRHGQPRAA